MAVSSCMNCGRCCTSYGVCVTPSDIERIIKASGSDPVDFLMIIPEPPQRERKEPCVLIDNVRSLVVLRWSKKRDCVFHGKDGCTIYPSRPMLCRTYPFSLDGKALKDMKSRACPCLWRPNESDTNVYLADLGTYGSDIERYRDIADEWNSKGGGSFMGFITFAISKVRSERM